MVQPKIKVAGIAIRPGISRNNIKYTVEELKKTAHELGNKPILKDHISQTDNVIGKTISASFSKDMKGEGVFYEGWAKEDGTGIVERIEDGRISEVSIGAIVEEMIKENEEDSHIIARGIHYLELSTTPTPGIVGTSISQSAENFITEDYFPEGIKFINPIIKPSTQIVEFNSTRGKNMEDDIKTNETHDNQVEDLKKQLKLAENKISGFEEKEKQTSEKIKFDLNEVYKNLAKEKFIEAIDVSKLSEETVKALINTLKQIKKEDTVETSVNKTKGVISKEKETFNELPDNYFIEKTGNGKVNFGVNLDKYGNFIRGVN